MKKAYAGKVIIYLLLAATIGAALQGCHTSKKCGCGSDLNNAYRPGKRYR